MASDGHSTICDVDKIEDYDNDDDGPKGEVTEDSSNFPEGGRRAWMTLAGRFDCMNHAITGSDWYPASFFSSVALGKTLPLTHRTYFKSNSRYTNSFGAYNGNFPLTLSLRISSDTMGRQTIMFAYTWVKNIHHHRSGTISIFMQ